MLNEALAAISSELDLVGDLIVESDGKLTQLLEGQAVLTKLLIQALSDVGEIPELRRRVVYLENHLNAAE